MMGTITDPLKQRIIQYITGYYKRNKRVLSVSNIVEHFKKEGLNFTRFDRSKMFPGRMSGACRLAGVPTPTE